MTIKINCLGDFCPIPAIRAKIAYRELKLGEKIMVISDHSCATQNIKDMLDHYNCKISIFEPQMGIWEITIQRLD